MTNAVATISQNGRTFNIFNKDINGPCVGLRENDFVVQDGVLYRYTARYGDRRPTMVYIKEITNK